jgi:hypothetical protein
MPQADFTAVPGRAASCDSVDGPVKEVHPRTSPSRSKRRTPFGPPTRNAARPLPNTIVIFPPMLRVGNLDLPAAKLEPVVDEAGAVH